MARHKAVKAPPAPQSQEEILAGLGTSQDNWVFPPDATPDARRGLNEEVVRDISALKSEPEWMLARRLKGLKLFEKKPMPTWGADLSGIDFDNIKYFVRSMEGQAASWEDLPEDIRTTYEHLGIPEAERQRLVSGVAAQFESEVVYHQIQKDLTDQGVIFMDTDTALREHPELFEEYFGSVIPAGDNKFAALNTAVWSGGSTIYVPPGVHVEIPLQAFFLISTENMGQMERSLFIADEGSSFTYIEGCVAPVYTTASLHSAVVEIIVKKNARVRYVTIQSWASGEGGVFNLVTKRAAVQEGGRMEWIDGNIGCLAEGSTVTTPAGVRRIEDVAIGEQVLSFDEDKGELCFREVTGKRESGQAPVREVRLGERRLRVTDNHPFYSYTYDPTRARKLGRYDLGYVRADELSEAILPITSLDYGTPHRLVVPGTSTTFQNTNQWGKAFTVTNNRVPRLVVGEHTTEDIMWLFGAYLGDGSMAVKKGTNGGDRYATVTFSIPANDRARPKLMRVMGNLLPGVRPTERKDGVTVGWSSVELAQFFSLNGIEGNAHTKRVPDWVLNLPESQRLAFIGGYLDSDGCAPQGRSNFSIKSANKTLLENTSRVLLSLGITSRIYTEYEGEQLRMVVGNLCKTQGAHNLTFANSALPRLLPYISDGLRDAATAQPQASFLNRVVGRSKIELPPTVEIRKVRVSEHLEVVPTWDIEVAGTGNFISEGFIVHNSRVTMKYPACYLLGERASGEVLSLAFAGEGQHQDTGAKMVHAAPNTTSNIVSKSVSRNGGRSSYRGLVQIQEGAHGSKSSVTCDALLLDTISRSDTYPYVDIREDDVSVAHEATVSKIGADQLFYLMSRGMTEPQAMAMIIQGFSNPILGEFPMEYALELRRLIELQMEGAVG